MTRRRPHVPENWLLLAVVAAKPFLEEKVDCLSIGLVVTICKQLAPGLSVTVLIDIEQWSGLT